MRIQSNFSPNSEQNNYTRPSDTRRRVTAVVLLLALLFGGIPSAAPSGQAVADSLQPILRELAASHPEERVEVILQVVGSTDPVTQAIEALGGSVFYDLHIINALGAVLPAHALPGLSKMPGVKWISYNAPTQSANAETSDLTYTTWATELAASSRLIGNFKNAGIPAKSTIWFSAVLKADAVPDEATVEVKESTIEFVVDGKDYRVNVPKGRVEFKEELSQATTIFDRPSQTWVTQAPTSHQGRGVFLTAIPYRVPLDFEGPIGDVSWTIGMEASRTDMKLEWQWAAAVYQTAFPADYNSIQVKPVDKTVVPSDYPNDDLAGTPNALKDCGCILLGATGNGGTDYVGTYTFWQQVLPGFSDGDDSGFNTAYRANNNMTEHSGPDGYYGWGSVGVQGFAGFEGTFTPGYVVSRVEVVIDAYLPESLTKDIYLQVYIGGASTQVVIPKEIMNQSALQQPGEIAVDITDQMDWQWWQFNDLVLAIDHRDLYAGTPVFYDAVGLRITSTRGEPDDNVQLPIRNNVKAIAVENLQEVFAHVVGATAVWNQAGTKLQGQGITVAVVDSGIAKSQEFGSRKFRDINFSRRYHDGNDKYGHGTFVAGMLAGNGFRSQGAYVGIAPNANVLNVRVSDDQGASTEADVVAALQWVLLNKDAYQIRVVNMSLNSSVGQSYHTSPLSIAAEILWFSGIVVVVSAGNNGSADLYPPANEPYVITVGATDDRGTIDKGDDVMASFSAYGVDEAGNIKPDLAAPGTNIIAYMPRNGRLGMAWEHTSHQMDMDHFRMSGTSMAAPVVAGAAVLLLQNEPNLTPNQVKQRLMSTADSDWAGYEAEKSGAGYVNIPAAVQSTGMDEANDDIMPTMPLAQMAMIAYWASGNGEETIDWDSIDWNSVDWNSVNWNSVNWNSVNWNSVNWNSVNWNSVNWNSVNWNSVNWNSVNWNSVNWNSTYWDDPMSADARSRALIGGPSDVPLLPQIHILFIPSVQSAE